jgi:hypothetical protein
MIDCARVVGLVLLSLLCAVSTAQASGPEDDRRAVEALEKSYAMVLAEQGFERYEALFHPDYNHWADGGALRDRTSFLAAVRDWYQAGNRATAVSMRPISTEIIGDLALSRYELREDFNNGESFVGRFVSLSRRDGDRWLGYRTNFQTLYYGATADAPALEKQP